MQRHQPGRCAGGRLAVGHDPTDPPAGAPADGRAGRAVDNRNPGPRCCARLVASPAGPRAAAPVGEVEDPPSGGGARPGAQPGPPRFMCRGHVLAGGLSRTGDDMAVHFLSWTN
jgi:hypothetical protein